MIRKADILIILSTLLLNFAVNAVESDVEAFTKRRQPPNFHPYQANIGFPLPYKAKNSKTKRSNTGSNGNIDKCEEHFRNTTLDHFAWDEEGGTMTFEHRYFICKEHWKKTEKGMNGPIFVYLGNEAPVTK